MTNHEQGQISNGTGNTTKTIHGGLKRRKKLGDKFRTNKEVSKDDLKEIVEWKVLEFTIQNR